MNEPEETMHHVTINDHRGLLAHDVALEAATEAIDLFDRVRALTWRLLHAKR